MTARLVLLLLAALLSACTHARDVPSEFSGCDAQTSSLIRGVLGYGDQQEQWPREQVDHVVSCVLANGSDEWVSHPLFPGLHIRSDVSGDSAMALSLMLSFQPRITAPRALKPHATNSRGRLIWELREIAAALGNARAQADQSLVYMYGLTPPELNTKNFIGPNFEEAEPSRALTNQFFAATDGDNWARVSLAHKHRYGQGVPKVCTTASMYLKPAADEALEEFGSSPKLMQVNTAVLSNELFKSVAVSDWDVVHWFKTVADMGSVDHARRAASMLTRGTHLIPSDPEEGMKYYTQAAAGGDKEAMAQIGHMYANGDGVAQDNRTALEWFLKSVDGKHPNPSGLFGLGYMFLHGYGVEQNITEALDWLNGAAKRHHAEALYHLGIIGLKGPETMPEYADDIAAVLTSPGMAMQHIQDAAAVRFGSFLCNTRAVTVIQLYRPSEAEHPAAMHTLAMHYLKSIGTPHKCMAAVELMHRMAYRRPAMFYSMQARAAWTNGDVQHAFWNFLAASETGAEANLMNAAWILNRGLIIPSQGSSQLALRLAASAVTASQENARVSGPEPTLAIAHAMYHGHGVPSNPYAAATHYRLAIKAPLGKLQIPAYAFPVIQSKLALGYMHQFGTGVPQDLHLAKRYYDSALGESAAAWFPARFALIMLSAHRGWREAASARPWLRLLEQPVMNFLSWSLHQLRRLCDPVYAFHAPTIPQVVYVPGALEPAEASAGLPDAEKQTKGNDRNNVIDAESPKAAPQKRDVRTRVGVPEDDNDSFWLDDIIADFWDAVISRIDSVIARLQKKYTGMESPGGSSSLRSATILLAAVAAALVCARAALQGLLAVAAAPPQPGDAPAPAQNAPPRQPGEGASTSAGSSATATAPRSMPPSARAPQGVSTSAPSERVASPAPAASPVPATPSLHAAAPMSRAAPAPEAPAPPPPAAVETSCKPASAPPQPAALPQAAAPTPCPVSQQEQTPSSTDPTAAAASSCSTDAAASATSPRAASNSAVQRTNVASQAAQDSSIPQASDRTSAAQPAGKDSASDSADATPGPVLSGPAPSALSCGTVHESVQEGPSEVSSVDTKPPDRNQDPSSCSGSTAAAHEGQGMAGVHRSTEVGDGMSRPTGQRPTACSSAAAAAAAAAAARRRAAAMVEAHPVTDPRAGSPDSEYTDTT